MMRCVSFMVLGLLGSFSSWAGARVEQVTLPALPDWATDSLGKGVFLDIDAVMQLENFSRLQAVETQNRMKDLLEAGPQGSRQAAYEMALTLTQKGYLESGWHPVVFDQP